MYLCKYLSVVCQFLSIFCLLKIPFFCSLHPKVSFLYYASRLASRPASRPASQSSVCLYDYLFVYQAPCQLELCLSVCLGLPRGLQLGSVSLLLFVSTHEHKMRNSGNTVAEKNYARYE